MRLIDADALIEDLLYAEMGKVHKFCFPCKEILQKIDVQPTIEPPTTEWLGNHTPFRCKRCGHYSDTRTPFCAYCGKKAINYE